MQFDLMYYLHMSIADFDNNDAKDNSWLHARLVKQKYDEHKAQKDAYKNSEG